MFETVKENLKSIYGKEKAERVFYDLIKLIDKWRPVLNQVHKNKSHNELSEKTVFLITYPDQIRSKEKSPLNTLIEFANRFLKNKIDTIHILPFYPYSSDDGFSVIDYYSVEPEFGAWGDIEKLAMDFDLMFDGVFNHISSKSKWFLEFLNGNPEYKDFFITIDDGSFDLSKVFRPRASGLLTQFNTGYGVKKVWTTFSSDQIDLNYKNPEVLLRIIDVFLFYVSKGATYIRLDAVAYLWKESGTSCVSLHQTHKIIQILRAILDNVAPYVKLITETNLPFKENISYFGNGDNEAHLVYNFPLPPLVLFTLISGDSTKLTRWLDTVSLPGDKKISFLNFLASHDGIGVMPIMDILDENERNLLIQTTLKRGGFVSYKSLPDGSTVPYELNINYLDALIDPEDNAVLTGIKRFLLAHAIMFAIAGVPAIYFHSLFGSRGDRESALKTGILRRINRQKLQFEELVNEMTDNSSIRRVVYEKLCQLLKIRRSISAFNIFGKQVVIDAGKDNFALLRESPGGDSTIIAVHNVSGKANEVHLKLPEKHKNSKWQSLFSFKIYSARADFKINIGAYKVEWLQKILG